MHKIDFSRTLGVMIYVNRYASVCCVLAAVVCLAGCPAPPTAQFMGSPTSGAAPLTVNFFDQSTEGSAAISSWLWDFGDADTSTLQNPVHQYGLGQFSVSLTVASTDGHSTLTKTNYITVTGEGEGEGEGEGQGESTITIGAGSAKVGGVATVPVNVTVQQAPGPSSMVIQLAFDSQNLTFSKVNPGPAVLNAGGLGMQSNEPSKGRLNVIILGGGVAIETGQLFTLEFQVTAGTPGDTVAVNGVTDSEGLTTSTAADPDGFAIELTVVNGQIQILP